MLFSNLYHIFVTLLKFENYLLRKPINYLHKVSTSTNFLSEPLDPKILTLLLPKKVYTYIKIKINHYCKTNTFPALCLGYKIKIKYLFII